MYLLKVRLRKVKMRSHKVQVIQIHLNLNKGLDSDETDSIEEFSSNDSEINSTRNSREIPPEGTAIESLSAGRRQLVASGASVSSCTRNRGILSRPFLRFESSDDQGHTEMKTGPYAGDGVEPEFKVSAIIDWIKLCEW